MAKLSSLKLRQLSLALREGKTVPIEKLGQRLRDIREALGMTQKQLAKKLKISQPALSRIEENAANCTLQTVIRTAQALGCEFLGVLSLRGGLEKMIEEKAAKRAKNILKRTFANMAMEEQQPGKKEYEYQFNKLVAELVANPGPELWDD